jgi:hypothetical protein
MKKSLWLLPFFLLLLVWGCKKDEFGDGDTTPAPPETSISFTCKDSTNGVPDVLIGISAQSTDRDAGIFLRSGTSDAFGKVKFSGLDPMTYFYSATRSYNGNVTQRKGSVQVAQDQKKTVSLSF